MANSIGFILFLVFCFGVKVLVHAQQQIGFISIDCGAPTIEYTDDVTGIKYSSEGSYIQTGIKGNISSDYAYPNNPNLPYPLSDLRSFPDGNRNCYRLIAGRKNSLHLIRASFLYGNYDGENKLPEFDLYVGVNFWSSVKFKNASEELTLEIINMAESDETNVCLVNKGNGIPFISSLELRPINGSIYKTEFGDFASLLLFKRFDIGSFNGSGRYEDDVYDRIWFPLNSSSWKSISTFSPINVNGDGYKAPFEVISNAATPRNENDSLEISWISDEPNSKFYVYLYFAEVEKLEKNQLRKFNVSWNGTPLIESFVPRYLHATTVINSKSLVADEHRISIHRTEDSTLPPILNAVEIYVVRQHDAVPTFEEDVEAISDVKESYRVQRNWVGDPCEPKNYTWEGLKCNYSISLPPRIISLNLSRSSLSGIIIPAISNLTFLESLDLFDNSLTGSMPQFLEELKSLKYLDLRGNQLSGFISTTFLQRSKNGLLTLRVDDKNLSGSSNKKKVVAPIVASVTSVLVLLVVAILYWKHRRRNETSEEEMNMINKGSSTVVSKKLQYTYAEVMDITSNLELVIGRGGFGSVYCGQMKDGNKVAVKMLSSSSSAAAATLRSSLKFSFSHPHPPSQFPNSTFTPHGLSLNPPKCTLRSQNPIPQNAIVSKPSPLELLKTSSADRYTKEKSSIIVIGLNVHTAPVEMREKLAIPEAQWPQVIQELCALNHIEEAAVLSTCNRIEIYLVALSQHRAVREVTDWISKLSGVSIPEICKHQILLYNKDATQHLFEVAAGLDSLVLGEGQILSQVKQVVKSGQGVPGFDRKISGLFKQAISVGKRVRTETNISSGSVSVSSAAVELAIMKRSKASFDDARVLVIGAGKMGKLVIKHLVAKGCRKMVVVNRSEEKVNAIREELKDDVEIVFRPLSEMLESAAEADVIFTGTASESLLFSKENVEMLPSDGQCVRRRLFIDISIPRNVDPGVSELQNALVYNVDDLREVVDANKEDRHQKAMEARGIIQEELNKFEAWKDSLETVPTIKKFRAYVERIRASELEKCLSKMRGDVTKEQKEAMYALSMGIVNKLLHGPMQHLRCDGNDNSLSEVLENMRALNRMYDLETEISTMEEKIRVKMERTKK